MDAKLVSKVAIRVLALFLIGIGMMSLPEIAVSNGNQGTSLDVFGMPLLLLEAGPFLSGIALWFLAPVLADWMVGKAEPSASGPALDAANLQTVAFAIVGLVFSIQAASYLLGMLAVCEATPGAFQQFVHSFVLYAQLARLVFGLTLLFGARFFTQLLRRFREFGLAPGFRE
jgi:hypothetical protein